MRTICFDIETGPNSEAELASMMPAFDADSVKTGNIKDEAKIAAKIAESKATYERDYREKAALDALTGRVLAIGYLEIGQTTPNIMVDMAEADMLSEFWDLVRGDAGMVNRMVGFNIFTFDLPFLIRRSWKYGIPIPIGVRQGRYWSREFSDLRETWQLGDRMSHGSLDTISKHLGAGQKSGHGADFAGLLVSDKAKALSYLRNDVLLTVALYHKLTV